MQLEAPGAPPPRPDPAAAAQGPQREPRIAEPPPLAGPPGSRGAPGTPTPQRGPPSPPTHLEARRAARVPGAEAEQEDAQEAAEGEQQQHGGGPAGHGGAGRALPPLGGGR